MSFSNSNICHDKCTHLLGVLLENEKREVLKARIQIAHVVSHFSTLCRQDCSSMVNDCCRSFLSHCLMPFQLLFNKWIPSCRVSVQ